jgi:lipid-binding SYLF domain-containing protein
VRAYLQKQVLHGAIADLKDAQDQVRAAALVVTQMSKDGRELGLLLRARGVFVVNNQGKGVLVAHANGEWSNPAFYSVSAPGSRSFAMILMNDKAVDVFKNSPNEFSLSPDSDDIIVWPAAKGVSGVGSIQLDEHKNEIYYTRDVTAHQILSGHVQNPQAELLRETLPTHIALE